MEAAWKEAQHEDINDIKFDLECWFPDGYCPISLGILHGKVEKLLHFVFSALSEVKFANSIMAPAPEPPAAHCIVCKVCFHI